MGKGLAVTGLVLSIIVLFSALSARLHWFSFSDSVAGILVMLIIVIFIASFIINLVVLIKKEVEGKILSWIGILLLIISVLIPILFKQIM